MARHSILAFCQTPDVNASISVQPVYRLYQYCSFHMYGLPVQVNPSTHLSQRNMRTRRRWCRHGYCLLQPRSFLHFRSLLAGLGPGLPLLLTLFSPISAPGFVRGPLAFHVWVLFSSRVGVRMVTGLGARPPLARGVFPAGLEC